MSYQLLSRFSSIDFMVIIRNTMESFILITMEKYCVLADIYVDKCYRYKCTYVNKFYRDTLWKKNYPEQSFSPSSPPSLSRYLGIFLSVATLHVFITLRVVHSVSIYIYSYLKILARTHP